MENKKITSMEETFSIDSETLIPIVKLNNGVQTNYKLKVQSILDNESKANANNPKFTGETDFVINEGLRAFVIENPNMDLFTIDGDSLVTNLYGTVVLPVATTIGSVSSEELQYINGVTSPIQYQIDSKADKSGAVFTGSITIPNDVNYFTTGAFGSAEVSVIKETSTGPNLNQATISIGDARVNLKLDGLSLDIPKTTKVDGVNILGFNQFVSTSIMTLPNVSGSSIGAIYRIINISDTQIEVRSPFGGNINGVFSYLLPANTGASFITDGTNWFTV